MLTTTTMLSAARYPARESQLARTRYGRDTDEAHYRARIRLLLCDPADTLTTHTPLYGSYGMKTTVEISDDLLKRSQQLAKREGTSLRALLEEGLRLVLKSHQARKPPEFQFPTFGQDGLSDEFRDASWETVRDAIYGGGTGEKP